MKKIMRNLALQYLNHANANPTIPLTDIPEEEEPAENPFCPDFISYDKMLDIVESLPEEATARYLNWQYWKDCPTKKSEIYWV